MATFTDAEIESIREVVGLTTETSIIADLSDRLTALNDAQAAACRADVTQYGKIAYGTTKSRGGIKGTDYDVERDRLLITNRMRLRLRYPLLAGSIDKTEMGAGRIIAPAWYTTSEE